MFSIKSSFANCSICSLLHQPSSILETNCKKDLSKVDVIFVAENAKKSDVSNSNPRPLLGKTGKEFRKYFSKFNLKKMNYLITSIVLCKSLNEDDINTIEEIDLCKENCFNIIEQCKPKLIVLMGTNCMRAFGFGDSGIMNRRGFYKWKDYDIFLTFNPDFINENPSAKEKFESDFRQISNMLGSKFNDNGMKSKSVKTGKSGMLQYMIPEKFYSNEFRLIDVQYISSKREVLYIFRDKNNKKVYHIENDNYYCYQTPKNVDANKTVSYDLLDQIVIPYKEKIKLNHEITYEGDLRITTKHAIDYYINNKEEAPKIKNNIMFCDIEIDTGINSKEFPKPDLAERPISMITTIYNKKYCCYVLDNNTEKIKDIDGVEIKIFKTEASMMKAFIKDVKADDPDFISGWNLIGFDMEYIYNRLPKLKISRKSISKFGEFYVDSFRFQCKIPGYVIIDQDYLYKQFSFTKKENYKLGFIAQEELGKTKIILPLPFNEMYWKKLNELIEYNIRDVVLLEDLEEKLKHISLLSEIRETCNTSYDGGSSAFGQIDSLIISHLKRKGLASKNGNPHTVKEKFPGAFVFECVPGIYNNITDFDFKSLYPSVIITYNIGINTLVMKFEDPHLGYELTYEPEKLPKEINIILDPIFKNKLVKVKKSALLKKIKDDNLIFTINGCFYKTHKKEKSLFSEVVEMLMTSRENFKNKMFDAVVDKNKEKEELYNTRQLVIKTITNALYGVLGNKAFRFFNISLSTSITLSGQEVIKNSITNGDSYMKHLCNKKPYSSPLPITKQEMFNKSIPNRKSEYIIAGDTDSIFCCFENFKEEKTEDRIKKWCNSIQDFLNNDIIKNIVKNHNSDLDFNRLSLKNELIISRGLFLAKKRYAIRIINKEGRSVEKIEYMGLEIKRSNYPSKSKLFLTDLLDLILKSENIHLTKILNFINKQEKEFIKLIMKGDKTIAKPVSYGKRLSNYKVIPQGVRAMIAWNELMYNIHTVGSRSYLFYVKGINMEKAPKEFIKKYNKYINEGKKLEVIAIPDEEITLPNFIIPDIKKTLGFVFTDRYNSMLKPLMEAKLDSAVLKI